MYRTVTRLIAELKVKTVMRQNVDKTRCLMLSQRLAFALAEKIGKTEANQRLHDVAKKALENELTLREAFRQSDMSDLLDDKTLDELLEPTTYIGLASQQTELVISEIRQLRSEEGAP